MSSHDISHCDGEGCGRSKTCHRYLQYLELVKHRGSATFIMADNCIESNHLSYWGVVANQEKLTD